MPDHHIIIDTDPGQDDALAILLALASPEIEIIGICAVAGNVPLYLTEVNMDASGDTHFPPVTRADWTETAREPHAPGPGDSCGYTILTLDRR